MMHFIMVLVGAVGMWSLFSYEDLKRDLQRYFEKKRTIRLSKGIPKRVRFLTDFDDIFESRGLPLLIDGKVYTYDPRWIHVNDECVTLSDQDGVGWNLSKRIQRSVRMGVDEKRSRIYWSHSWGMYLNRGSNKSNGGRFVQPSSITEIY